MKDPDIVHAFRVSENENVGVVVSVNAVALVGASASTVVSTRVIVNA